MDALLHPNPAVLTAEVAIAAIAAGTLVLGLIKLADRKRDLSFYRRRFGAWWTMGAVFLLAVTVDRRIPLFFLGAISFLAVREYFSVVDTRAGDRRALLWVFLSIPAQYYWASRGWYEIFVIFIPVCMLLSVPLRMVFAGKPEGMVGSIGRIHWGMMLFVFGISHLALLLTFEKPWLGSLLLYVVLLTELSDVAQFLLGLLSRRYPVVPELSARKTWPGLAASVAVGAWLGSALRFLTTFNALDAALIGAGIALTGFAGSLVVTAVRRDVNAAPRDTRVLDNIDSYCYTAPLFCHLVYLHQNQWF